MSKSLVKYAKEELERVAKEDEAVKKAHDQIIEIIEVFSKQKHSLSSGEYVVKHLQRLLSWQPLIHLTGEEDEWEEPSEWDEKKTQQNRRCPTVFRTNFDNSTARDSRLEETTVIFPYEVVEK